MTQDLQQVQTVAGATFETTDGQTIPVSFGNDEAAWTAAQTGVALADRSHWGRIQVSDRDRIRFLHNQTTQNFQVLQAGQGCQTVFVTSTARTHDLVTAYVTEDEVILLTSPRQQQRLIDLMDRYIFFADQVKLSDWTDSTVAFSLLGPDSDALLAQVGLGAIAGQPDFFHQPFQIGEVAGRIAVESGLAIAGYTLIVPQAQGAALWQILAEAGAIPLGEQVWQQLRVQQGRPMPGQELTEDYNPLEAGLWHAISFEKGCYIGQETIARLQTYKGVKQQLWGIQLQAPVAPGSAINVGEDKVGVLTSMAETPDGPLGLGYVRTKAGTLGLTVQVGETTGRVIDVPFLTHGYLTVELKEAAS